MVEFVVHADGVDDSALQAAVSEADEGCPFSELLSAPERGRRLGPFGVNLLDLAERRRTHKAFGPDPVPREALLEILSAARFAPTHHMAEPWRFRVLGPRRSPR